VALPPLASSRRTWTSHRLAFGAGEQQAARPEAEDLHVLGQSVDDHDREGPAILHRAEDGLRAAVANELSIDLD
jgi:hypothetical protein